MSNPKRCLRAEETLIVGGGPIGCLLATLLHHRGLPSVVLDAKAPHAPLIDRTLALSWLTVQTLSQKGLLTTDQLTPITSIQVGEYHDASHAWKGFTLTAQEAGIEALGYTLPYTALQQLSEEALHRLNIPLYHSTAVERIEKSASWGFAFDQKGHIWSSRAVVLAEGGQLKPKGWTYEEHPITHYAWIASLPINTGGVAYERFSERGVLAFLPKKDNAGMPATTLIFSQSQAQRDAWQQLSYEEQNNWLAQQCPASLTWSPDWTFLICIPLKFQALRSDIRPPIWAVGNASQIIHPIAGLGFNLGVRDVLDTTTLLHNYFRPTLEMPETSLFKSRHIDRRYIQTLSQKLASLGAPRTQFDHWLRALALQATAHHGVIRSVLLQSLIWGF